MNPEGQMRLSDSVKLFGLCTDMCPEYERVRRIVEEDVKPPECTPDTQHLPRKQRIPDETRMVKAYTRSAAGMDVELVSEIRSPATCLRTINYLMQRLDGDDFDFLHSWIWDRTRSIRKDLRTQRIEQRPDINLLLQCLERCARFLLLAAHQMARTKKEDYTYHQDIEQLNATLISLQERYVDNRRVGYPSENEAEFWAYRLILAPLFKNPHLEDQLHALPLDLRNNRRVHTAIEIFRTMKSIIFTDDASFVQSQANWKRFWDLIKSPSVSYLMACAAEISFQRVRHAVLDGIWRSYRKGAPRRPQQVDAWKPDMLKEVLGFDTTTEAVNLCEAFGFQFKTNGNNQTYLDVTGKGFVKSPLLMGNNIKPQTFSNDIVEMKRFDRAFSAVVQAMSVREAKAQGLMVKSAEERMEEESPLFFPETSTKPTNPFAQPSNTASAPSSNPFLPKPAAIPAPVAAPNPFVTEKTKQDSSSFSTSGIQPGVFDAAKNPIKFATPEISSTPFANLGNSFLFGAKPESTPTNAARAAEKAPAAPAVNPFLAYKLAQPQTATAPATVTPTGLRFPGLTPNERQPESSPLFSNTPAGSPGQPDTSLHDAAKQKAEEEEKQKKAAAEALAQQQRAREEEARQARAEAERKRLQAEEERQRLEQEARDRVVREMRERKAREEEARRAQLQEKESTWDTLATDCMLDPNDGLLWQYLENLVGTTASEVEAAEKEAKRRQIWEEKKVLANAMYEQRLLGLKRLVMATWLAKIEKKKRAEQARDRRRRLKERKAHKMSVDLTPSQAPTPTASEASIALVVDDAAFQKPRAPASARRTKRTEERRGTQNPQQNGSIEAPAQHIESVQQAAAPAVLTPVSMNGSQSSSLGYSEAYKRSTAPIDRTETDYFQLRAQGLDPRKFRKRSFDSSSGDETPKVEPKRPKIAIAPQTTGRPRLPSGTAAEDIAARLHAVQESFRKSGGSPKPVNGAASADGRSSLDSRRKTLLEQAKKAIGKSTTSNTSPPSVQHDWSRSVPNLAMSTSSGRRSVLGKSTVVAPPDDRPAYWARKSRFVPQHLYGQGPEAVRAYRVEYGLNSPAASRASTTEPPAASSPIPTQQSYPPQAGYAQEEYSGDEEEASDIEIVDVDAEDEEIGTTEEEYEGDEESEEEEDHPPHPDELQRNQSHPGQQYDEEGDSPINDGFGYANGYVNGQYDQSAAEALDDYEVYTGDEEDDEEDTQHHHPYFAQQAQHFQPAQHGKPAPPQFSAGGTEDDAIELSD
jgi:hypothetical protein